MYVVTAVQNHKVDVSFEERHSVFMILSTTKSTLHQRKFDSNNLEMNCSKEQNFFLELLQILSIK